MSSPTWTRISDWDVEYPELYTPQPALADLDNDGDNDVLIGEYEGVCYAYQNVDPTPPVPELSTIILMGTGLLILTSYIGYTQTKNRKKIK